MLSAALGRKTWASASQPSRSSRCGQSVGTERKLPRWPHVTLRQSWLTRSLEHSNRPVHGVSECTTRPTSVRRLGRPVHLDVAEAVEGEARLEHLAAAAAQDVGLLRPRRAQVGQVQRAVLLEHLGEAQPHRRAALALDLQPHPADHVLAEVDDMDPGRALGDRDRLQLLGDADRLRALGHQRHAVARARAHRAPVAELAARVVVLAVQQVRVADRPGRRAPALVARHHLARAVRVLEVQLAQQLGCVP